MTLRDRVVAFERLGAIFRGEYLHSVDKEMGLKLGEVAGQVYIHNGWFTPANVHYALQALGSALTPENIGHWLLPYQDLLTKVRTPKTVGVIAAGNIPLAGFHDFASVLLSGHNLLVKCSVKDSILLRVVADVLIAIAPGFADRISFESAIIKGFDGVIATGSNNSARYFDYYFGKYPHVIRKNRNSIGVLDGHESEEDLQGLSQDMFQYFGLGCRNFAKVYVPENYNFDLLFGAVFDKKDLLQHSKYFSNYEYNKAVYLLNDEQLLENGFLLLKQDTKLSSPVAVLFYEYYTSKEMLASLLSPLDPYIQCVVGAPTVYSKAIGFGKAQQPALWDYADGVDTMHFLLNL